jgi:hypothetical protein
MMMPTSGREDFKMGQVKSGKQKAESGKNRVGITEVQTLGKRVIA